MGISGAEGGRKLSGTQPTDQAEPQWQETTSTHDNPWVGPAETDIPNTLCPINNYDPLWEIQG